MKNYKGMIAVAAVVFGGFAATGFAADAPSSAVNNAVGHYARPPIDRSRDAALHPAEVLALSGIKSGMVVADFIPGDAYYTRILSKLVGPKGKV